MHKPIVFLDSSVIIAALLSGQGGSAFVITQLRWNFKFQINEYVLKEVQEIIKTKFSDRPNMSTQLFLWMGINPIVVIENPTKKEVVKFSKYISQNDAPILSSALNNSDYLLNLGN
jgi:predicted nucleic acid-binding protein